MEEMALIWPMQVHRYFLSKILTLGKVAVSGNITLIVGETTSPDIPMVDSNINSSRGGIDGFYFLLQESTIPENKESTNLSSESGYFLGHDLPL